MLHFLDLAFQYFFMGAIIIFGILWVVCGIMDIPSELREGGVKLPSKYYVKKRMAHFFIGVERWIALATGHRLKLPMYRRRLIREAKAIQYLLERQRRTNEAEFSTAS